MERRGHDGARVTYSATGGTISSGGLYTAGSTAGTFRVIAVQQGGTLADTARRDPDDGPAGAPGGHPDAGERLVGHGRHPAVQRERAVEQRGHDGARA